MTVLDDLEFSREQQARQQLAGLVGVNSVTPVQSRPEKPINVPMKAGVQLDRVNPALRAAATRMINDNPYGGYISSGFRSIEAQRRLYNSDNPYPVAAPGKSKHNFGEALDISGSPQARQWFAENAAKYGLHIPHKNDPVHYELINSGGGGSAGGGYTSPGANFFNSIIRAEGTASGGRDPYNTSLGFMKSPKPLTEMSMDEVMAWGEQVRAAQGMNSSAKGAFQIVNATQRKAMDALGIGGDEKFSPENQRRMAVWIAKTQGLGAWEGLKKYQHEMANARNAFGAVNDEDIKNAGWNGAVGRSDVGGGSGGSLGAIGTDPNRNNNDFSLSLRNAWDAGMNEVMQSTTSEEQRALQKQYEAMLSAAVQTPKFTQPFEG